tara:strand:- start:31135 stop:31809 length:675 start_codon:yes stop_codon:yes gene_type:complete
VAVVIDVLRATSVMATALAAGAAEIITCLEIEQARQWKTRLGGDALLCGERQCKRIEGFDLGNSPGEYSAQIVRGRTLVLTTTNGTRAINAARHAGRVVTASFLNLSAVVDSLAGAGTVMLVCAGTDGETTGEDTLLAGAMAEACQQKFAANLIGQGSATALAAWQSFRQSGVSLAKHLRETAGGRNLVRYGFESDLDRCAMIDSLNEIPTQVDADPAAFVSRR